MVLVDTSVWIDHLRYGRRQLENLLNKDEVMVHPYIIGELACGQMKSRKEVLFLLTKLPESKLATHTEVLSFIEQRDLMGLGIGYIDAHLLASALISSAQFWTKDKKLKEIALDLNIPHII